MSDTEVLEIARQAILVMLKVGAPVLAIALVVGLAVSLVQALTQIQEMTLAFVPKILAIFAALFVFLPFMVTTLTGFTHTVMDRIAALN